MADTHRILTMKRMVYDLMTFYNNRGLCTADEAMDRLRDLVESECCNRDIPLEAYEWSDDYFLERCVTETSQVPC